MNEEKDFIPSLTLDPTPAASAAAVEAAPIQTTAAADTPVEKFIFEIGIFKIIKIVFQNQITKEINV